MMPAAVSVPGEPKGVPVNDSIAAPMDAWAPGAGIKRSVRLEHRDGAEVEVTLTVRTALAHTLDDARSLPHRVPMDAGVARDDDVCVEAVARLRQDVDQQIGRRRVVGVL